MTHPGSWSPAFGLQGASGEVLAVAVSGSQIYIGGSFTKFGGQPNNTYLHVAEWTGSRWVALGQGVSNTVYAITLLGGKVYAGGDSGVQSWDGVSWTSIGAITTGGQPARVRALANDGTELYLGGDFDTAGGTAANSIAAFTPGAGFAALGAGVQTCTTCGNFAGPGSVHALLWADNRLWVAGYFDGAGGLVTDSVASWAASWTTYGAGLTSSSGFSPGVGEALATDPATHAIYVGGRFDHAGTQAASGVAELLAGAWSGIGDITAAGTIDVNALLVQAGNVYATGAFTSAGGVATRNLAVRTGTTWSELGGGLTDNGDALAPNGSGGVIVAGAFSSTADAAHQLASIAVWQAGWQSLGTGGQAFNEIAGQVNAFASDGSGGIWAGGQVNQFGAVRVNNVGHWTGSAWEPLGAGVAIGTSPGVAVVHAMVTFNGQLYVAGQFDHAGGLGANNIARWDGTSWHALGSGISGRVNALAVVGGKIYAAGAIDHAGGLVMGGVAVWNPTTLQWSTLPGRPSFNHGNIYALTSFGNRRLYIGGDYADITVNGSAELAPGVVSYDTLGTSVTLTRYPVFGGTNGRIDSLVFSAAGDLYLGGQFTAAGSRSGVAGTPAVNIAIWRGGSNRSWAGLAGGTDGTVSALTISDGSVFATGTFTRAGGASHPGIAAFNPSTLTWSGLDTGLLGQASSSTYGQAYGNALLPDGAKGVWAGGQFVQTGPTPAGSINRWITS